jgi:hypothetical protein
MAKNERKRQEKMARRAAQRKQHNEALRHSAAESGHSMSVVGQLALAASAPVHECLVPQRLFEDGMGTVVVSRRLPNGNIATAGFLLDVWCLGVKNAFVKVTSASEYPVVIQGVSRHQRLKPIDPTCARKLVEEAEAYAADLGFNPHPDYQPSRKIFGDIDKSACSTQFRFGENGKPHYLPGPYDTAAQTRRIVDTLRKRCGPDGFHCTVMLGGPEDLAALAEMEEDDDLGEEQPGLEDGEPQGVASWLARLLPFRR